jgi:phosphonopyruvate decarboxylase
MKLNTYQFGNELKKFGFDFYSGVPCSFLNNLINYAINDCHFIMSANEGDAVATCAGAYIAGKKSVVLMQNSGLTNATSPITSLNYSFRLPVLGFVSLRGEDGLNDEPQHELTGKITEKMLSLMDVKWEYLSNDIEEAKLQLVRANKQIENNKTFFFVVKKGTFDKVELETQPLNKVTNVLQINQCKENSLPNRLDVLVCLHKIKSNDSVLLATTGKTGRELYEIEDSPNNLYMVGSMGCISSLGLGIALNTNKKIIAIDGDGALLMRMGNLATNAYYAPSNLLHLLIDNNMHDSTGGQFTVAGNIDFVQIASSVGYEHSIYIHSLDELEEKILQWEKNPVLTFMYIKIKKGTKENLSRPTIKPYEVKDRLMDFLSDK